MTDFAKTTFTESAKKLIAFKTSNAPAKAGGSYQLMDNKETVQWASTEGKAGRLAHMLVMSEPVTRD